MSGAGGVGQGRLRSAEGFLAAAEVSRVLVIFASRFRWGRSLSFAGACSVGNITITRPHSGSAPVIFLVVANTRCAW